MLHLAEHAAFNRIEAARAARRFPIIVELLADGRIHLSAVRLLAPHLTEANHDSVLGEASHKSKREIEQLVARLLPRPDAPSIVCKLPQKPAATENTAPTCGIDSPASQRDAGRQLLVGLPHRRRPSHSPRGDSRCSSRSEKRRTANFAGYRIFFATDCPVAILMRFSIAR